MSGYVATALEYAREVTHGREVACKWVQLACQRQLDDLDREQRDPAWPHTWSPWHAEDVCAFLELLPHVEGSWDSPTLRLEPWQMFVETSVYGWRTGPHRRFSTVYEEVARKNAKSTKAAGNALYCLTCEGENGPQVKIAATTGDQAWMVFGPALKMVQRTQSMRAAFGLEPLARRILCHANGGEMGPINAKASSQDGLNPHMVVLDELHAHRDRALFDVLRSARGARKNPLTWIVTTAGYNLAGVCHEQREMVCRILEGTVRADHYFGVIYTLDEGDDPFDETVWRKANPNLGVSVSLDEMRAYAEEAQVSPDSEGEFKTKRLSLWLGAANAWLNITQWDHCAVPVTMNDFEGEACWIGVDLASKNDVAALALIFERGGDLFAFCRYYLPEQLVRACAERTYAHYETWARDGLITLTPGNMIDYDYIEADIDQFAERFDVRSVGFDPYQSNQIATSLVGKGLNVVTVGQTVKNMSEPAKELESRIQAGRFRHDGDPVLRWMAGNVVVFRDQKENIMPKKDKPNSANKIDGVIALIIAIARWQLDADDAVEIPDDYEVLVA